MLIKRILKEIYMDLFPKKFTIEAISERTIERYRSYGAKIGENVVFINVKADVSEFSAKLLTIGDTVVITNARILLHDASTKRELGYTKFGRITIGSHVFIGAESVILPGTTIGDKVIVGAGCVVGKDIPDNSVVIGNPCRVVCTYDEYMEKMKDRMQGKVLFDGFPQDALKEENKDLLKKMIDDGYCFTK